MINAHEHKEMIDAIFNKYGLPTSCYEIVSNVQEWCKENDIEENNNLRPAKCLCRTSDGAFHIVFKEVQTDEMISSAKSAMEINGFSDEVSQLDTDAKYFEHLILHEISCKVLGVTEQKPRDTWSFKEMGM